MDIFNKLSLFFRINNFEKASDEVIINNLINRAEIVIPKEYLEIIREKTEIEILIKNQRYIRIWGAEGCIEMNEAYSIQNYIPKSLAIGDDEGGNAIIYATGEYGFGLYAVAFNDLEYDGLIYISKSLKRLLIDLEGLEVLLNL